MGSVWLALRAGLRSRWRPLLGLALLLGLIGGVVLTAAAGARRTDTAYPRLLQWSNAASVLVIPHGTGLTGYYGALARRRDVASMWTSVLYNMGLPQGNGVADTLLEAVASPDGALGVSVDRVRVVQGRMFDPADPGAVMVDQQLAGREHLRPGSTLRLLGIPSKNGNPDLAHVVPLAFRVSAVVAFDNQIVPSTSINGAPTVLLSPAFYRTAAGRPFLTGDDAGMRLAPGASPAAFVRAASALAARYPAAGRMIDAVDLADEVTAVQRAIGPQAIALAVFAALAGLVALAVMAQLLSRQLSLDAVEFPVLRALGMTRGRLAALSLAEVGLVTAAGGLVAVATAVSASPLMPIGPARLAEPSPGVEVNFAILGAGFAAITILPLAVLAPFAWAAAARAGRPGAVTEPGAHSRVRRLAPALGLAGSVTGAIGVRMALEPGHGRTAVPVRSALAGTTIAVGAVVAALVFSASLIGLVNTPHRYGQNWAQALNLGFGAFPAPLAARFMASERSLAGYAGGDYGQVSVGGRTVPAIGIDPLRGRDFLTLLAGRAPSGRSEIALGTQTLRAIHRRVGQTVPVVVNGDRYAMRIVGAAVFASFSRGGYSATDLGNGAAVAASVLSVPFPAGGCTGSMTCYNFILLRYKPGTNLRAAAAHLTAQVTATGCPPGFCLVSADQRPSDIRDDTGVRDTPLVLAVSLALLAVATLTHVLLTSVRRRRRDLAIFKTLGLLRPQVLSVVLWQACALTAVALLAGLPLGIVAGRWSWAIFAGSLGVATDPTVPAPALLAIIPAALILAGLIAAGPGWRAAQIRPAAILRSE
jgi:ABC-type antimicrobial peptide transport system permease subunit